ncbi:MAG: hypothetical protein LQ342_008355 [Letrouitia transgressa]|nr:MAG: hypothetical protein LQ342_008355 [Letrouitia transgressa]
MTLWHKNVKLDGSHFKDHAAIALFIITLIVFVALLFIHRLMHKTRAYDTEDAPLRQRAFSLLGYSLVALLLYYVLRIIILAIAETRASITAGYFFAYVLTYGLLNFANADLYFLAVIVFLLIRSATDTHIVVKYGVHKHIAAKKVRVVEEVLYGLPSVVIYYSLERLSFPVSPLEFYPAIRSKLLRQGRAVIRKDFKRRRVDADNGGPALPTCAEILQEIEHRPLAYLPISAQSKISEWPRADVQLLLSKHYDDLLAHCEKS